MSSFPRPLCAICGEHVACRARGQTKPEYPRCHRPLLGTSVRRVADLLAWWTRSHPGRDPRLEAVQAALLARLGADRTRFSEVFEPSCSHDAHGWHFWRFSYAFPGFHDDPTTDARDLLGFCRPFGDAPSRWVETLLAPARDPAVSLPLVGLAYDTPAAWRLKLYLQFHDEAGDAALRVAARLTGRTDLQRVFRSRSLHLIGIDLGQQGIAGAKLYFRLPEIRSTDVPRLIGPVELLEHLSGTVDRFHNLLVIHRMHRPDDPAVDTPAEVDFALPENELCWSDLGTSRTLHTAGGERSPLAELATAFAIGVRRVSVPVGEPNKLNVYYVPTEVDPVPTGDPPDRVRTEA